MYKFVPYTATLLLLICVAKYTTATQFHVSMDEDLHYLLDWSYNNDDKTMDFTIRVKTTGWVGFGISPYTGKMPGSDVVIGWVDNSGKAYLQDRFATGRTLPALDSSQDYTLISGFERNGTTTLTFRRKYDTEDPKDLILDSGTTRLIWAYNYNDPPSPNNIQIHDRMGTRSVNLFNTMPESDKPQLPSDTQSHECLAPNVTVPARHTSYWCVGVKLPQVVTKHHIVKIAPVVTKGNEGVVHHMTLFECQADPKWHGYSADCDSENMPDHLKNCRAGSIIAGWAVGGEAVSFPENTGFPIGGKNNPKFGVIEIHYDNPEIKADIVDSSGFDIYYTKQLRETDVGVIVMGHLVTPMMMIPNNQMRWNVTGYCPDDCTSKGIPATGINIFGFFFHTHLAGVALKARHFRKGKELPLLAENKHYDFNYQEVYYLKNQVKMYPGDSVALTCDYTTAERNKFTVGGTATRDEMCLNYVYYYPKIDFTYCATGPDTKTMLPLFDTMQKQGYMPEPVDNGYYSLLAALSNTSVDSRPELLTEIYNMETYPSPIMYCSRPDRSLIFPYGTKVKNFKPAVNYTFENPIGAAASVSTIQFLLVLAYAALAIVVTW